jgi:hypothetical protein
VTSAQASSAPRRRSSRTAVGTGSRQAADAGRLRAWRRTHPFGLGEAGEGRWRVQHLVGQNSLQFRIFLPSAFNRFSRVFSAEFGFLIVDRRLGDPVLASRIGRLHPRLHAPLNAATISSVNLVRSICPSFLGPALWTPSVEKTQCKSRAQCCGSVLARLRRGCIKVKLGSGLTRPLIG